jgi:hypothetical protein
MKSLISPWGQVFIDDSFGHEGFGLGTDNSRVIWGPFAVLDCKEEFMTEQLVKDWLERSDQFTIDLRDISVGEEGILWQWFSNRDHRFTPNLQPVFEDGILKCKSSIEYADKSVYLRNYWFRQPNESEWEQIAPGVLGQEQRFRHVLTKYYG